MIGIDCAMNGRGRLVVICVETSLVGRLVSLLAWFARLIVGMSQRKEECQRITETGRYQNLRNFVSEVKHDRGPSHFLHRRPFRPFSHHWRGAVAMTEKCIHCGQLLADHAPMQLCGDGGGSAFIAAIADTHPKDGDVEQAPLVSGGGAGTAIAQGNQHVE